MRSVDSLSPLVGPVAASVCLQDVDLQSLTPEVCFHTVFSVLADFKGAGLHA